MSFCDMLWTKGKHEYVVGAAVCDSADRYALLYLRNHRHAGNQHVRCMSLTSSVFDSLEPVIITCNAFSFFHASLTSW